MAARAGAMGTARRASAAADQAASRDDQPDLADQARARLEEMIVTLALAPGSVWSEAELSHKLGIGRTPVREALQRLESEHMVTIVRRHGARITDINVKEQLLLLELRRALERLIAVGAARRATPEERGRFLDMARRLERLGATGEVMSFLRFHYEIKRSIAECARNRYAARAISPCHAMSRRFYYLHYQQTRDLPLAAKLHADVIRAIAGGNEGEAAAASDRLMDYVETLTRSTVTERF